MTFSRRKPLGDLGFVACKVDEVDYAIAIELVKEIIQPMKTSPLPQAPPEVVGTIVHRERVIPIFDLRLRLGLAPHPSGRAKWVLVEGEDSPFGLIVDQVTEVFHVGASSFQDAPQVGSATGKLFQKVIPYHQGRAYVLNIESLLQGELSEALH